MQAIFLGRAPFMHRNIGREGQEQTQVHGHNWIAYRTKLTLWELSGIGIEAEIFVTMYNKLTHELSQGHGLGEDEDMFVIGRYVSLEEFTNEILHYETDKQDHHDHH